LSGARFDQAMRVALDRVSAADLLDRAPHRAESLHVLARGLDAIDAAIEQLESEQRSGLRTLSSSDREKLNQLRQRLEAAPQDDRQLSTADLAARREARRIALRALRRLRNASLSRRAIIVRRSAWIFAGLVCVGLVGEATLVHDRIEAVASERYSVSHAANNVLDGNNATEWLARDDSPAWIELRFRDPISVSAVRVVNARNAPFEDRATKDLEVTLFNDDHELRKATLTLPGVGQEPDGHSIAIAGSRVTRVRLSALSYYGKGAGFAEIQVIEQSP